MRLSVGLLEAGQPVSGPTVANSVESFRRNDLEGLLSTHFRRWDCPLELPNAKLGTYIDNRFPADRDLSRGCAPTGDRTKVL